MLTPDTADPTPLTAKTPNVSLNSELVVLHCEYRSRLPPSALWPTGAYHVRMCRAICRLPKTSCSIPLTCTIASRPIEPESGNQAPPDAAAQSPDLTDGAPNSATTNNKPRTPDAAGTPPTDTKVSPPLTGECGGAEGYTCLGSQHGDCCSSYGYCGSEESYCGAGCQTAFGRCGGGREDAKTG